MDSNIFIKRRRNPKECAHTLSLITFFYVNKILRIGEDGDIKEDDLFYVHKKLRAKQLGDKLETIARKLMKEEGYLSTIKLLILFCARKYIYLSIIQLIMMAIFVTVSPFLLGKFVLFFSPDQHEVSWEGACFFGISYVALSIMQYVYEQNYTMIKEELRIEFQTALCSLVYRKSLRLSPGALSDITIGKIVSLISKDISVFGSIIHFGSDWCVGVIQIMIIVYLFYRKTGAATFVGFAMLFTTLPVQVYIAKVIKTKRTYSNKKSDERLQLTQEILAAIRIIKMYTWEKFFCKRITEARRGEMNKLRQVLIFKDVSFLLGRFCSVLSFYMLISSYVWMGNTLSAELVFYLYSSYDNLEDTIVRVIPISISQVGETIASLERYNVFMNAEEIVTEPPKPTSAFKFPRVCFSDAKVQIQNNIVLKNVTVEMKPGLNIITGHVGSGKTLLIKTILGEYEISSGEKIVDGNISYASQYPWLFPSTIRQNILFGEKYEEEKYKRVLDVCALDFDLKILQYGDKTIIGDCGINLSKGQQSRVNLARAIYRNSEIYLLDDCLSSLDPNVRRHIFSSLKIYLMDKVCVLVTHHKKFLDEADNIIIMNEGSIIYSGQSNSAPPELFKHRKRSESSVRNSVYDSNCNGDAEENDDEAEGELLEKGVQRINIYQENKNAGKVPISVYQKYILFGGGYSFYSLIVLLLISAGILTTYGKEVLSQWVDMDEHLNVLSKNKTKSLEYDILSSKRGSAFNTYTVITIFGSAFWLMSLILHFYFASKISIKLHTSMIESILGATMEFFDKNLIGNILNRFSKDIYYIDENLVYSTNDFIMVFVIVVSTATLISSINKVFFISSIIFEIFFVLLGYYLLPIGRNLRRLNSSTRSPMVGHLNASLEGIATVRAWRNSNILKDEFDYHQDLYTSAHHTMTTFTTGFSLILKAVSSIFMAIIVGNFLFVKPDAAGKVGLCLTQVSLLTYCLESCLTMWVILESEMTCFERTLEYTEIEQEPIEGKVVAEWPSNPVIRFEDVCLSYGSSGKNVLKNLNFVIEGKERAAIVGRTGAGKSSIIVALFRLYDNDGSISIDSVDTRLLPLEKLRENLTIIPQDPILFTGSMRSNLDPYEKYTDDQIWNAVKEVNLDKHIIDLDYIVRDCGAHLSIGQRQLICIARAILDRHKIIILDEATANMDEEMESLIHGTIEKHFRECTVISISHRLRQILHYDKVLVMEEGELVEFGRPQDLLRNQSGLFYKMAQKAHLV